MSALTVSRTQVDEIDSGEIRVSTTIDVGGEKYPIWYIHPNTIEPIADHLGDIWFPAALLTAMSQGLPLVVEDAVSQRMARRSRDVQEIYASWFPRRMQMTTIDVGAPEPSAAAEAKRGHPDRSQPPNVATTFTAGVDSFHTLIRNEDRVTHLLYFFGLDFGLDDPKHAKRIQRSLQEVADDGGTELLVARTNVRDFMRPYLPWGQMSHGATLVGAAVALSAEFDELLIPASHRYRGLRPWGSSPLVDPQWSSDRLEVFHDGCIANRLEKIEEIQDHRLVQKHLRVCARRVAKRKRVNCGKCRKCMITAAMCAILGSLDDIETLDSDLDLQRFRDVDLLKTAEVRDQAITMIERAEGDPDQAALVKILKKKVKKFGGRRRFIPV